MKIRYKLKPEKDRPLKIGDKVRVKTGCEEKLAELHIRPDEFSVLNSGIIVEGDYGFDFNLYDHFGVPYRGCTIEMRNGNNWLMNIELLEKIVIKKKSIQKTDRPKYVERKGGIITSLAKVPPIRMRVKH